MITPRRTRLVRTASLHGFREAIAALTRQLDRRRARDSVVLVPTGAAADQLRRTLERSAGGDAPRLPHLLTREGWHAALAARAGPPLALLSAVERYVLMQAAAREAAEDCPPPFAPRPGLAPSIVDFYDGLLRQGQSVDSFERLLGSDLEASADIDRGAERLLVQTRFLAAAFRAFERRSAASGRCDEHALRRKLLAAGLRRPVVGAIVTLADQAADANGLWPADFDLLAQLEGLERIDIVATDAVLAAGYHERLHDRLPGIDEERFEPSTASAPVVVAPTGGEQLHFVRRDREDELREVARALRSARRAADEAAEDGAGADTAVVFQRPLPYLYLAHQVFPQAGIPFQTRDAFPLAAEPFAAALDLVIEFVRSGHGGEAGAALLRSPHFQLEQADGQPAAALAAALGPLQEPGPPSAQLALLAAFLRRHRVAEAPPAAAAARERRAADAVVGGLEELAHTYRTLDDTPMDFDELAASVRRWIESRTESPQTGSAGVHLVDARAAIYGRFHSVFVVGLVDDDWPPPPQQAVFYPQPLLRVLGWAADRERLRTARARFGDLLRLADARVTLSAFALDDDAPVIPSMFLEEVADAGLAVERQPPPDDAPLVPDDALLLAPPLPELPEPAGRWLALRQGRQHGERYRGAAGTSRRSSYTTRALEHYLDCPFQYFARYELGLEAEPGADAALSPYAQGALLGRLMARFWAAWQADGERSITAANVDRALDRMQTLADDEVRAAPAADRVLLRAWLCGSAAAPGVAEQLCRLELAHPAEVVERLVDLPVEDACAAPRGDEVRRVRVRGSIDRVDLLSDGTFRVVDYRAGGAPTGDQILRLAAHTRWAERRLDGYRGRTWRARDAVYVALADARLRVPLARGAVEPKLAEGVARAAAALEQIGRGAYPVRPSGRQLCTHCAYAAVCRKEYAAEP